LRLWTGHPKRSSDFWLEKRKKNPAGCSADGPQAVSPLTAAEDASRHRGAPAQRASPSQGPARHKKALAAPGRPAGRAGDCQAVWRGAEHRDANQPPFRWASGGVALNSGRGRNFTNSSMSSSTRGRYFARSSSIAFRGRPPGLRTEPGIIVPFGRLADSAGGRASLGRACGCGAAPTVEANAPQDGVITAGCPTHLRGFSPVARPWWIDASTRRPFTGRFER